MESRYLSLLPWTAALMLMTFSFLCLSSGLRAPLFRHPQLARNMNQSRNVGMPGSRRIPLTSTETPLGIHPTHTPPLDTIVRLHQKARLRCEWFANSKPGHSPTWLRSNQFVVGDSAKDELMYRYALDFATGDLLIANVRPEDAGLWHCAEHDPKTGGYKIPPRPIRVIVTDPPKLPYLEVDGRRLDPGNQFLPLVQDEPLNVRCVVDGGLPAPNITWSLTTRMPTPPLSVQPPLSIIGTNGVHQQLRSEARISSLLREHHNATVTCSVHHIGLDKPLSVSVRLDVQYSAAFAITRWPGFGFPIVEGIPVSLKCDIDSNPPTSPLWLKDNALPPVPQTVDGFLNFSAIQRNHMGWYKCTNRYVSSNGIFLNVRHAEDTKNSLDSNPKEARRMEHHIEMAAGGAVRLECPLSSPACWGRGTSRVILQPTEAEPDLNPQNMTYEHIASHRCARAASPRLEVWRSALDEDKKKDQSELGAPVVFPPNTTINVYSGQRVELKVEFCANPPPNRAFWVAKRLLMVPGESNTTFIAHNITAGRSPHCYIAALTLRKIRLKSAGEYVFLIRSPRGIAEGSIMLNVTKAASYTERVDGKINVAPAHTLLGVALLTFLSIFLSKVLVL